MAPMRDRLPQGPICAGDFGGDSAERMAHSRQLSAIGESDSIVYEKDLGARTAEIAREMHELDPRGRNVAR